MKEAFKQGAAGWVGDVFAGKNWRFTQKKFKSLLKSSMEVRMSCFLLKWEEDWHNDCHMLISNYMKGRGIIAFLSIGLKY